MKPIQLVTERDLSRELNFGEYGIRRLRRERKNPVRPTRSSFDSLQPFRGRQSIKETHPGGHIMKRRVDTGPQKEKARPGCVGSRARAESSSVKQRLKSSLPPPAPHARQNLGLASLMLRSAGS